MVGEEREREDDIERETPKKAVEFELKGLKLLKRGGILVGHSSNNSKECVHTPPPTWTFQPDPDCCYSGHTHKDPDLVTARQLGADLFGSCSRMSRMSKLGSVLRNKGVLDDGNDNASDDLPVSTGTFHRQIAASVMQHHQSFDKNRHPMRPVSPASYGSSLEVTPYNHAATPSSSTDYKTRLGDPTHNLKTSTELIKVLNRIWSLEEQHSSNISYVRGLKSDLDNARNRIKQLLREKQMDKEIIDDLMKQVAEHKLAKKNMDLNRVQSSVQSLKEELDDERKLRKRSESMHRKLAREIYDMKTSFSKALNELERERGARILLEDLCDEFAMGIRDYEQELRSLEYKGDKEHVHRDQVDSLLLHVSEAWLDERVQMRMMVGDKEKEVVENGMIVDKLRPEIETFLNSRENIESHTKNSKGSAVRRQSLESFPLNESTSAPRNAEDEDDVNSIDSDSHCFELNNHLDQNHSLVNRRDPKNSHARSVKNTEKMGEIVEERLLLQRRSKRFGNQGVVDNLIRTNSSSIEGERIHPVTDTADDSHGQVPLVGPASPMKKWDPTIMSEDGEIAESSSRWGLKGAKANSLKAKLLEARMEGRNSLLKGCRGC